MKLAEEWGEKGAAEFVRFLLSVGMLSVGMLSSPTVVCKYFLVSISYVFLLYLSFAMRFTYRESGLGWFLSFVARDEKRLHSTGLRRLYSWMRRGRLFLLLLLQVVSSSHHPS